MAREQARTLLTSFEGSTDVITLRDRALISVMLFAWERVTAVCTMRVCDFEDDGEDAWLNFQGKGGKQRRVPCHRRARIAIRAYLQATQLDPRSKGSLFQTFGGRGRGISGKALRRTDAWNMVKRRCAALGLPARITNHSFRATAITLYTLNGGRLQDAQAFATHADPRTTLTYIRGLELPQHDEIERVQP